MQIRITEEGTLRKCEELKEKNIPIRWAILDDMWAEIRDFYNRTYDNKKQMIQLMHRSSMYHFEADPIRFPNGLKHCISKMKEYGFGRILNTTSGIKLDPQQAGYSASKAALDKITIDLGHTVEGTDVMINLADPGWCRTDLGGPAAPNSPESALPGIIVGAFVDDKKSGRWFGADMFHGMTLEEAVEKAEKEVVSPYN